MTFEGIKRYIMFCSEQPPFHTGTIWRIYHRSIISHRKQRSKKYSTLQTW